ncbi:MAG: PD40 domain-containing protein, partial [Anaerolineae bacterium]|nr:PD40 domain-containing protein [Anaerolineae bacterium]
MRHLIPILVFVLIVTLAPAASAAGVLQQDSPPLPGSLWEATPWIETGPEAVQPGSDAPAANIVPWARMVFQSYRDNNWEIYGANPDGSGAVRLTNHPALDKDARLNRGATRIVFASDRAGGDFDIFAMNADGSGVTALTNDSTDDQAPAWSPDGARVVFESYRHGIDNAEVYVMNGNGSGQTRLTNSPGYDGTPSYSPDGSKIAFVSNRNGPYRIMVMNADGSGQQVLSNQQNAFDPVWSPDGRQIAYDADYDGDNWEELWLMNADGSNQHMIYNPSGDVVAWARSWSPDGRYLAFSEIALVYYQGNWYWTTG